MQPTITQTPSRVKKAENPDKVKAAFDRGVILKTVQSVYKLSATTNNFELFANLESSQGLSKFAGYSQNGRSPLTAEGYSLAFKIFLLGPDFSQINFVEAGTKSRLDAITKLYHTTQFEVKIGDDPLRKGFLSDIADPLPLIINPLLSSGSVPANTLTQPAVIPQPASSLENDRNLIRLPQEMETETKITFEFKTQDNNVGTLLADHIVIGKWALEENSKRRIR